MGAGERGRRGSVGRGRRGEGETAVRRKVLGEQMGEGGVGVDEAGCWLAGGGGEGDDDAGVGDWEQ